MAVPLNLSPARAVANGSLALDVPAVYGPLMPVESEPLTLRWNVEGAPEPVPSEALRQAIDELTEAIMADARWARVNTVVSVLALLLAIAAFIDGQ